MPRLTRWFIRAAFLALRLGLALGALLAVGSLAPRVKAFGVGRPAP